MRLDNVTCDVMSVFCERLYALGCVYDSQEPPLGGARSLRLHRVRGRWLATWRHDEVLDPAALSAVGADAAHALSELLRQLETSCWKPRCIRLERRLPSE